MFDNRSRRFLQSCQLISRCKRDKRRKLTFPAAVEKCCEPGLVIRYTVEDQPTAYDRASVHELNGWECLGQEQDSVHTREG